mmetsp:Transcript_23613/g.34630  ORF Transcript_23613/g.34630 Transcript_23613/m.34630 type:complete len:710 (-) Transcript_23613:628-2757(-)
MLRYDSISKSHRSALHPPSPLRIINKMCKRTFKAIRKSIRTEVALCMVIIGVAFISLIISMLPIILNGFIIESLTSKDFDSISKSIRSDAHIHSLLLSIACCFVLSFDNMLDMAYGCMDKTTAYLPQFVMLLSIFAPNLVMYISYLHGRLSIGVFSTCVNATEILLQTSLLCFHYQSLPSVGVFATVLMVQNLSFSGIIILEFDNYQRVHGVLKNYALVALGLSVVLIFGLFAYRWYYIVRHKENHKNSHISMYAAFLGFNIFGKYIVYVATASIWQDSPGYQWTVFHYIDIITVLVISTMHGRLARENFIISKNMLDQKKSFVRYISHEIRTPMNTIYMGIKYVTKNISTTQSESGFVDIKETLGDISESCDVAINTLNNILDYDKLESGEMVIERKFIDVVPFLSSTVQLFVVQAKQLGIHLRFTGEEYISPSLYQRHLYGDPSKISQVIRNLVSNALKFTAKGGCVEVFANVVTLPEENSTKSRNVTSNLTSRVLPYNDDSDFETCDWLQIEVKDNGVGLSRENQNRLFKECIQFDAADLQNGNGSGLGLLISRSIVEAHGGVISVNSSGIKGEGCSFKVLLKLHAVDSTEYVGQTTAGRQKDLVRRNSASESSVSYRKVNRCLVVDDSPLNRKFLCRLLHGYVNIIDTAQNGNEACEKILEKLEAGEPYDVVCMDSIMPVSFRNSIFYYICCTYPTELVVRVYSA